MFIWWDRIRKKSPYTNKTNMESVWINISLWWKIWHFQQEKIFQLNHLGVCDSSHSDEKPWKMKHFDHNNGGLEDEFPFQTRDAQVPYEFSRV